LALSQNYFKGNLKKQHKMVALRQTVY